MTNAEKEKLKKEITLAKKKFFNEGKKVTILPNSEQIFLNMVHSNNNLKNLIIR